MGVGVTDREVLAVYEGWGERWRAFNRRADVRQWRSGLMKAKEYDVLVRAVEEGARYGVMRFYKHRDEVPGDADQDLLADAVAEKVISSICEWFDFDRDVVEDVT